MEKWEQELLCASASVSPCSGLEADFGGAKVAPPRYCVSTRSVSEVLRVFEVARRYRVAVATVGAGHSSGHHTSCPGGIVLRHAPPQSSIQMDGDVADVPGHVRWHEVESALRASGRDLPVATSSLKTTVAGTLSLGGFGVRSLKRGGQVDHVESLRLVQMDGRALWCSEKQNATLFRSALTGVGQVGWIERARIRTARYAPYLSLVRRSHPAYRDLAESVHWMQESTTLPDCFSVLGKGGTIESTLAGMHVSDSRARGALAASRVDGQSGADTGVVAASEFESEEREMPLEYWKTCRNLWCDYFTDAAGFAQFAEFLDQRRRHLDEHLVYVMSLAPRCGDPLSLDPRPPCKSLLFSVGLFLSVSLDDTAGIDRARGIHREALSLCVEGGGRPYLHGQWGGREGLAPSELSRVFGSSFETLMAERHRADPDGLLNPNAMGRETGNVSTS